MSTVLIESVCFHPDNAGVVRVLGMAVVVIGLAGLGWQLRDVIGAPSSAGAGSRSP